MTETLSILCWEGYDTDAVLAPFRQRTGVDTRARTLISDADAAEGLAGDEAGRWDILNINNAWVRDYLHPRGLVEVLDEGRFGPADDALLPGLERLFAWRFDGDGARIGICQRFGTFNLVVDTRRVSRDLAEDQGFELANDRAMTGRFGLLTYEDFNLFHVCLGSGLDPFQPLEPAGLEAFSATARRWHRRAALVTDDHHRLNAALVGGDIDFYLSGGVYTVSPARLAGHNYLRAITPRSGPIGGRGAVAFVEITSVLARSDRSPRITSAAASFLEYLLQPETAARVAFLDGTCNPVAQMGDERVRSAFDARQLDAIQWDSLHEDMARCADYQLPPDHRELRMRLRAAAEG